MNVIGYTESGSIRVIFEQEDFETSVPDNMANRHRYRIWDEWEMGPADDEGNRERVNTIPPFAEPAPDLDEVKRILKIQIDDAAEAARLQYITGGAGQAMTYQQKATEATNCLAETNPKTEDYPLLAAEVGITAETLLGVAQLVFEAHQQWRYVGAQIEALRLNSKREISFAQTVEEAELAAQIDWP